MTKTPALALAAVTAALALGAPSAHAQGVPDTIPPYGMVTLDAEFALLGEPAGFSVMRAGDDHSGLNEAATEWHIDGVPFAGSGFTASYTFTTPGTHIVTATLHDNAGNTAVRQTAVRVVDVRATRPMAIAGLRAAVTGDGKAVRVRGRVGFAEALDTRGTEARGFCGGDIRLAVRRGKRAVTTVKRPLAADCRFDVRIPAATAGDLRVVVRYLGTEILEPATAGAPVRR